METKVNVSKKISQTDLIDLAIGQLVTSIHNVSGQRVIIDLDEQSGLACLKVKGKTVVRKLPNSIETFVALHNISAWLGAIA